MKVPAIILTLYLLTGINVYLHSQTSRLPATRQATIHTADSLQEASMAAHNARNYTKAVDDCTRATELFRQVYGESHKEYAASLYRLSLYHYFAQDLNAAIETGAKARHLIGQTFGLDSEIYITSLTSLAQSYNIAKIHDKAIETQKELVDRQLKLAPATSTQYISALTTLANFEHEAGEYAQSVQSRMRCLSLTEHRFGPKHKLYAEIASDLSVGLYYTGNYSEAIRYGRLAANTAKAISGEESSQYGTAINNLANYHSANGEYSKALKLREQCLELRARLHGDKSIQYAQSLSNIASTHMKMGNVTKAVEYSSKALDILAHDDSNPTLNIYCLSNHATYLLDLGNHEEAAIYTEKALTAARKHFGERHPEYAKALSKSSLINYHARKISEAIALETDALEIFRNTVGDTHTQYITTLSTLAIYHSQANDHDKSIALTTEALKRQENATGRDNILYATILSNLAVETSTSGNHRAAVSQDKEAAQIYAEIAGRSHPDYASIISNIAVHSFKAKMPDEFINAAEQYTDIATRIVCSTFPDLTSAERNLFWDKYDHWYSRFMPKAAATMPSERSVSCAYDCVLFAKGLLLNSEIEMRRLIAESGDKEIIDTYDNLRNKRRAINMAYSRHDIETTDSLQHEIMALERKLASMSKAYGDFTRNLRITWKEVKKRLGKRDAAIEFVSFPLDNGTTSYAAFIIRNDSRNPEMVILPALPAHESLQSTDIYTTVFLSEIIWKSLESQLNGIENIYFSPDGELYNIAIESLPDYQEPSRLISDRWNIYRLSSTRQLAISNESRKISSASIYGGLKYDTDTLTLIADSRCYPTAENAQQTDAHRQFQDRGTVSYLPASRTEAISIDSTLSISGITSDLKLSEHGTEASLKSLSGKGTNILHIATHGFYWTHHEARRMGRLDFLNFGGNSRQQVEDKALTRSGLLLSGANNALSGLPSPRNVDDGILTAREISHLDLRGMELVTLSACQTALGEITGEGVFGLQRGFKKAGAKSVLMSLWKVDDQATALLMSQFYKHWTSGHSKHESLKQAQKALKNDSRFNSPVYWAAFILLDGIR